jgi:hypothetical protein
MIRVQLSHDISIRTLREGGAISFHITLPKTVVYAALLHNGVCGMAGFDFAVYCEMLFGNRTVPNVMVTFPMPDENAPMSSQLVSNYFLILSHYIASLSQRSDTMRNWMGAAFFPFNSSNSGTANRTRSISASKDPDSSTSPGTSSLSAVQTHASGSHVSLINSSMCDSLLPLMRDFILSAPTHTGGAYF